MNFPQTNPWLYLAFGPQNLTLFSALHKNAELINHMACLPLAQVKENKPHKDYKHSLLRVKSMISNLKKIKLINYQNFSFF